MVAEVVGAVLLVVVGLVHVLPGVVAIAPGRAATAYGTDVPNRDLELLLRHRAVLLALVGIGLIVGAFVPSARPVTIAAGILSTGSFLVLTMAIGPRALDARTLRVARIDVGALAALVLAVPLFGFAE
ncbi:hypothetical protein ATM97_08740 [Nocardia sp. MH4]|uniref:hypothetical protein n=1 Tax=unclassified Nocardia TaxID=2637762 RepID=UPI001C4E3D14|nr:hypothetical protein [Nocardia sp. MH4]MBW0275225.1 hypothetical protein [Nocardia sp. MH4]